MLIVAKLNQVNLIKLNPSRVKFSMAPSVAPDQIKPRPQHSVQLHITSRVSVKPSACHLRWRWGGSWFLSVHSFSVRGQLVLLGPSPSQRRCRRRVCVSALSRVIAMCQRAWPSLTRGICRLVCAAWVTKVLGCPGLSSPYLPLVSKDAGYYCGHTVHDTFRKHSLEPARWLLRF